MFSAALVTPGALLLSEGAGHFNLLTALSLLEESRRATEPVASQLQGAAKILLGTAPRFGGEDAPGDRLAPLLLPIVLLGEGSLALWLHFGGVNVEQWRLATARPSTINPAAR